MPYEVVPIEGSRESRTRDQVAQDIQKLYDRRDELKGEIVGEHDMVHLEEGRIAVAIPFKCFVIKYPDDDIHKGLDS